MSTATKLDEQQKIELIKKAFLYSRPNDTEIANNLDYDLPIEDLGIQSITALQMAGYIEETLDIEFADSDLSNLTKIRDLMNLIDKSC